MVEKRAIHVRESLEKRWLITRFLKRLHNLAIAREAAYNMLKMFAMPDLKEGALMMLKIPHENLQVKESEHYMFHFAVGSAAAKDIDRIMEEQERCYALIASQLQAEPPFKLHYVLVSSNIEAGAIYQENFCDIGPVNGFAVYPDAIVAVYNESVQCIGMHEDTHLFAYQIGDPYEALLVEGLAMYMDQVWWDIPNEEWVYKYIKNGQYVSVQRLFDNDTFYANPSEVTYPIAGSFTRYAVDRLSMQVYLAEVYCNEEDAVICLERLFHKPIEEIERDFCSWIIGLNDC